MPAFSICQRVPAGARCSASRPGLPKWTIRTRCGRIWGVVASDAGLPARSGWRACRPSRSWKTRGDCGPAPSFMAAAVSTRDPRTHLIEVFAGIRVAQIVLSQVHQMLEVGRPRVVHFGGVGGQVELETEVRLQRPIDL